MFKRITCNNCGHKLKVYEKLVLLKYVLLGQKHQYVTCNHCLHINSLFIYHNIVKDNEDKLLKEKNRIKADEYR